MKADYHVHTEFSDDSSYDMEDVVKDAIDMDIKELCFTDHVDYGIKDDWDKPESMKQRPGGPGEPEFMYVANVNYPKYYEKYKYLKKKYGNLINLKLGLEFGVQTHTIDKYNELFSRYSFDFIILSIHQVKNLELWTQDFQKNKTQDEYNMEYYQEILDVIKRYKNYSVLGHLDLISRYDLKGKYPFNKIKPLITEILKRAIEDGKGIEINTSSHRYGLKDTTPSRDILKLYKKLGGKIITIGSDSHRKDHLGAYINEAKSILKQIGFDEYCTFDQMKPIFHKL